MLSGDGVRGEIEAETLLSRKFLRVGSKLFIPPLHLDTEHPLDLVLIGHGANRSTRRQPV